jgi:hypothetical protein
LQIADGAGAATPDPFIGGLKAAVRFHVGQAFQPDMRGSVRLESLTYVPMAFPTVSGLSKGVR